MTTTLDLPEEIIVEANRLAAIRKTTLQALIVEGLRRVLQNASTGTASRDEALARLHEGFHLGGGNALNRDEIYD